MEETIRFVMLAQTDRFTITDLCEQFGGLLDLVFSENRELKIGDPIFPTVRETRAAMTHAARGLPITPR
jgi:hypothetical protein